VVARSAGAGGSAGARLLGLRLRIPPGGWMCLMLVLCSLVHRVLPSVVCPAVCDTETSTMRRPRPTRTVKSKGHIRVYEARILCKVQILLRRLWKFIHYRYRIMYIYKSRCMHACMHRKFFSACTSKTGNVHIKTTQRRVRLTIVTVEKQWVLYILFVCL
jgi:hypothetical protein